MGTSNLWDGDIEDMDVDASFFQAIQECIAYRLEDMKTKPHEYGKIRESIVFQLLQLTEFALIHIPAPDGEELETEFEDLLKLIAQVDEDNKSLTEPATPEWVAAVVDVTCHYIMAEASRHEHEHRDTCENCRGSSNESN